MKITIAKSEKEFDCIAAWRIIGEILNKPESVIGLSTGRTPATCIAWLEKSIPDILLMFLLLHSSDWTR